MPTIESPLPPRRHSSEQRRVRTCVGRRSNQRPKGIPQGKGRVACNLPSSTLRLRWLLLRNAVNPAAATGEVCDVYLHHLSVRKASLNYCVGSSVARHAIRGHHNAPIGHVEKYFLSNFHDSWIPNILLWILGFSIPFFELIAGIAFCVGFRAREMAFLTGLLLIVTTYGHSLMNPLYNITQGLTFSRVVFVLVLLILPDRQDYISIDKLLLKLQVKQ